MIGGSNAGNSTLNSGGNAYVGGANSGTINASGGAVAVGGSNSATLTAGGAVYSGGANSSQANAQGGRCRLGGILISGRRWTRCRPIMTMSRSMAIPASHDVGRHADLHRGAERQSDQRHADRQ